MSIRLTIMSEGEKYRLEEKRHGVAGRVTTRLESIEEVIGAVRWALETDRSQERLPSPPPTCMVEGCENIGFARHPTKAWNVGEDEPLLCETHARTLTHEELEELRHD